MKFDKEHAASRQLDTAIELLFKAGDIVSVHTLASASSAIFSDLLHAKSQKAWRDEIVKCFPGKEDEVIETLRRAERFFKHADKDPYEELEFEEATNDETIIVATLEYGELIKGTGKILTTPMSVFQMWYFAKSPDALLVAPNKEGVKIAKVAQMLFRDLNKRPRFQQLALGAEVLKQRLAEKEAGDNR